MGLTGFNRQRRRQAELDRERQKKAKAAKKAARKAARQKAKKAKAVNTPQGQGQVIESKDDNRPPVPADAGAATLNDDPTAIDTDVGSPAQTDD